MHVAAGELLSAQALAHECSFAYVITFTKVALDASQVFYMGPYGRPASALSELFQSQPYSWRSRDDQFPCTLLGLLAHHKTSLDKADQSEEASEVILQCKPASGMLNLFLA